MDDSDLNSTFRSYKRSSYSTAGPDTFRKELDAKLKDRKARGHSTGFTSEEDEGLPSDDDLMTGFNQAPVPARRGSARDSPDLSIGSGSKPSIRSFRKSPLNLEDENYSQEPVPQRRGSQASPSPSFNRRGSVLDSPDLSGGSGSKPSLRSFRKSPLTLDDENYSEEPVPQRRGSQASPSSNFNRRGSQASPLSFEGKSPREVPSVKKRNFKKDMTEPEKDKKSLFYSDDEDDDEVHKINERDILMNEETTPRIAPRRTQRKENEHIIFNDRLRKDVSEEEILSNQKWKPPTFASSMKKKGDRGQSPSIAESIDEPEEDAPSPMPDQKPPSARARRRRQLDKDKDRKKSLFDSGDEDEDIEVPVEAPRRRSVYKSKSGESPVVIKADQDEKYAEDIKTPFRRRGSTTPTGSGKTTPVKGRESPQGRSRTPISWRGSRAATPSEETIKEKEEVKESKKKGIKDLYGVKGDHEAPTLNLSRERGRSKKRESPEPEVVSERPSPMPEIPRVRRGRESSLCRDEEEDPDYQMQKANEKNKEATNRRGKPGRRDDGEVDVIDQVGVETQDSMKYIDPAQLEQERKARHKKNRTDPKENPAVVRPQPRYAEKVEEPKSEEPKSFESTAEIRASIYNDWKKERMEKARKESKEKLRKKKEEEEKIKKAEEEKKMEAELSYRAWAEKKKEKLGEAARKKARKEKEAEEKKKAEEEEKELNKQKFFEIWEAKKKEQIEEDRRQKALAKRKKEREEEEKKHEKEKDNESALKTWKAKKEMKILEALKEDRKKQMEEKKYMEEEAKQKDKEARQRYEKWLSKKGEDKRLLRTRRRLLQKKKMLLESTRFLKLLGKSPRLDNLKRVLMKHIIPA